MYVLPRIGLVRLVREAWSPFQKSTGNGSVRGCSDCMWLAWSYTARSIRIPSFPRKCWARARVPGAHNPRSSLLVLPPQRHSAPYCGPSFCYNCCQAPRHFVQPKALRLHPSPAAARYFTERRCLAWIGSSRSCSRPIHPTRPLLPHSFSSASTNLSFLSLACSSPPNVSPHSAAPFVRLRHLSSEAPLPHFSFCRSLRGIVYSPSLVVCFLPASELADAPGSACASGSLLIRSRSDPFHPTFACHLVAYSHLSLTSNTRL